MMKAFFMLPLFFLGLSLTNPPPITTYQGLPEPEGKIIKAVQFPGRNYQIKTVVIDPGHGGHDPGCSGAHSKEKHLVLAIGKYLAQAIETNFPDVKVLMTRSTDVFIPLNERAKLATVNNADLFISIHCNYMPGSQATNGAETFVLGLHATEANLAVAKRENASILFEEGYEETYGYDPNSPEAHIMLSMFQNAFLDQSIRFATKVQERVTTMAERKDRGVKQAGFLVLRYATMPSVLVETGFLSNRSEESYLSSEAGQMQMANALLMAFGDYKNELEGKAAGSANNLALLHRSSAKQVTTSASLSAGNGASSKEPERKSIPVKQETKVIISDKPASSSNASRDNAAAGKILPTAPVETKAPSKSEEKPQIANIQYRVQLAASPKLLDVVKGHWSKVEYLIEVVEEDGLYKYQVRNFATQNEAEQAKQKLRAIGFTDAFTVGYQKGVRVYPPKPKN